MLTEDENEERAAKFLFFKKKNLWDLLVIEMSELQ